ncbi:ankyrin repeat domain-containing protein 50 [Microdochium nivale]|nr:ankyrin repeat domain-containing protein 50 [Microdochium nivale]
MSPPPPSRPPGLIDLPTELVGLIASHLDLDSDLSALCRAHRRLDRILSRTLYLRHAPLALVAGVVAGNTATVQRALDLCSGTPFFSSAVAAGEGSPAGEDVLEMVFAVDDARRLRAAVRTRRPYDDDDDEGNCLDKYDEEDQTCRGGLVLGHYTALAFAVMCNQAEVVRVLLEHLARREQDNSSGQETTTTTTTTTTVKAHIRRSWALHLACQLGYVAVASLLLERTGGGSVVVCDRGHTRGGDNWYEKMRAPLTLAVGWERAAVVELLLQAGGGILLVDKQERDGKCDDDDDDDGVQLGPEAEDELVPQLVGAPQAFLEMVVPKLIAHGLQVHEWRDAEAKESGSLAWWCLEDLQLDKLEFLIDAGLVTGGDGARPSTTTPALPRPALHVAARDGRPSLVRRLLDLGAQPADPLTAADAERLGAGL